jgi:hypothetical protein
LSPRDFRVGRNSSGRFFYLEGYPFAFAIASESGTNPVSFTVFGSGDLPAAVRKRPEFEKTEKNAPFFITRDPADPESYRPFSASFTMGIENRRSEAEGSVTLRRFGNRIVVLNRSLHRVSVRYPERSRRADRALAVLEEIASMEVRPGEKRYPGLLVPWTDGTLRFNPGWRRDRSGDDGLVFMDPVTDPVHTLEIVRSLVPEGVAAAEESVGLDPAERLQFAAYLKLLHAFTENEPRDAIRRLASEINRVFGLTSDSLNVLTKKVSAYLRKTQMGRRSPGAPDIEGAHVLLLHFLSLESVNGIAFDENKMNFRRLMKASPRLDGAIDRVARQLYASA